jgi:hypothetical protein
VNVRNAGRSGKRRRKSGAEIESMMGHIIEWGDLIGTYQRD